MNTKLMGLIILSLGMQANAFSQTCSSSTGVDLSKGNGAFASLPARDQGQLGTCYAHSGSDLISSYLKIGRINIYQTAVANDTSMDGGDPGDVVDSFAKLGWACTDTGIFGNLFPSVSHNIIGELQDTFMGTPIFYTNTMDAKGIARQSRIAEKAALIAKNNVNFVPEPTASDIALEKYLEIDKQISALGAQIRKLEDDKSWFGSNTEINQKIANINIQIKELKKKADAQHVIYVSGLNRPTPNLDSVSEDEAAEMIFVKVKSQWSEFSKIMKKYGVESSMPSLATFIVERVGTQNNRSYAGAMYPYKIVKDLMAKICPSYVKTKIPTHLRGASMSMKKDGAVKIQEKIESILETGGQAVSVSFNSSVLTGTTGEQHAVNIIGCRTNGHNTEYLLQNSWGQGCSSYKASLQNKCDKGRIWVPSTSLLNSTTGINWITKK